MAELKHGLKVPQKLSRDKQHAFFAAKVPQNDLLTDDNQSRRLKYYPVRF